LDQPGGVGGAYHYDEDVRRALFGCLFVMLGTSPANSQGFSAPAGSRQVQRHIDASILPGGRLIRPAGTQFITGSGPFGLAVSRDAKTVVTANGGPGRNSLTIIERDRADHWDVRHLVAHSPDEVPVSGNGNSDDADWRSVFMGIAFTGEHSAWISEGNSGRIALFDWSSAGSTRRRTVSMNQKGYEDSYTGDLALDAERNLLYVVDQANFRVAVLYTRTRQTISSIKVGRLPFAMTLSADRRKLYVTNLGMFEYRAIPGADAKQAATTGLAFPAFGFPSAESAAGADRTTAQGAVKVPGLGDPNVRESNSVAVIDVSTPASPKRRKRSPSSDSLVLERSL